MANAFVPVSPTISSYTPFSEVLTEALKNPVVAEEWERNRLAREVAIWVLQYRIDHKLSQPAMGRLLGMKQQAISRLEDGEVTPSIETIRHLCKTLGGVLRLTMQADGKMDVELIWVG